MKRFIRQITKNWKQIALKTVVYSICLLVATLVLFGRLGTLPGSLSTPEIQSISQANSLSKIGKDPTQLPHKLATWVVVKLGQGNDATAARSVSALYGLLTIVLFYRLARRWHTRRMAILGSLLLLTSSWFLHSTRLAVPALLPLMIIGVILCLFWLRAKGRLPKLAIIITILALSLYVPGMIWLITAGVLWQRRVIALISRRLRLLEKSTLIALGLLLIFPLLIAAVRKPDLLLTVFGLPADVPGVRTIITNTAQAIAAVSFRGPADPIYNLGRLPLISSLEITMIVLGSYVLFIERRHSRSKILAAGIVIGGLLTTLGGINLIWFLPFVYLLTIAGLSLMLQQWLTVFPRNPLSRSVGVGLIVITVLVTSTYHLQRYFIAWPSNIQTRQAFHIKS